VTVSVKNIQNQSECNLALSESGNFEALFEAYWSRVYGVVYRIIGDPAEAQDLTLETFLRLHQRPPRRRTNLGGWLYRVATNLAFNALRARKRRTSYETQVGEARWAARAAENPGEAFEQAEERHRVRQALSRMKRRGAKILILRHSGCSYAEIAAAVGVAASSVGTLLARAEGEFERLYEEDF
jgi:RNA polymerase sigma-70 factor (ECF subfamily)